MGAKRRAPLRWLAAALTAFAAACSSPAPPAPAAQAPTPRPVAEAGTDAPTQRPRLVRPTPPPAPLPPPNAQPDRGRPKAVAPPAWLGTRVLPRAATGYGEIRPTPPVLRNRRLITTDRLPPPADQRFAATIERVPRPVARRSTWEPACPVTLDELRYVTVSFWGFDGRPHTGELLVNATAARDLITVFKRLYRARFPIEEMRVVSPPELDAPPTGDGNNTTSFVCRPTRGSTSWSQHAYGLAVDINPFHNPYVKGEVVLPELASAYVDRSRRRPGMHLPGGPAVRAFESIGWTWGGTWNGLADWMHFSANGR